MNPDGKSSTENGSKADFGSMVACEGVLAAMVDNGEVCIENSF